MKCPGCQNPGWDRARKAKGSGGRDENQGSTQAGVPTDAVGGIGSRIHEVEPDRILTARLKAEELLRRIQ